MDKYSNALNKVLTDFQFIEECLKMYMVYADRIIQINVSSYFPYKYNRKDVEKLALGKLTDRYSKLSDNISLVKQIQEVMKKRNDLAHQGFLFTSEEQKDTKLLESLTTDLEQLHIKTKKILFELSKETSSLEEHLTKGSTQI